MLARMMTNPTPAVVCWNALVIIISIRTISLIRDGRKLAFRKRKYVGSTVSRRVGTIAVIKGVVMTAKIRP